MRVTYWVPLSVEYCWSWTSPPKRTTLGWVVLSFFSNRSRFSLKADIIKHLWREATHTSRRAFHPRSETLESKQCNPVKRSVLGNHLSLSSSGILGWHTHDWTSYGGCEWGHRFFGSLKNHCTLSSKIQLRVTFTNDAGMPWPVWLNAISHGRDQHQATPPPSGSWGLKSFVEDLSTLP